MHRAARVLAPALQVMQGAGNAGCLGTGDGIQQRASGIRFERCRTSFDTGHFVEWCTFGFDIGVHIGGYCGFALHSSLFFAVRTVPIRVVGKRRLIFVDYCQ